MLKTPRLALAILATAGAAAAQPKAPDVSGTRQITGSINAGAAVAQATPVCAFKQTGAQFAGSCEGPHAQGPVTGAIAGRRVSWQWRASPKTLIGLSGTSSFEGDLGADGVVRGTWTTTQLAGAKGTFSAQRR